MVRRPVYTTNARADDSAKHIWIKFRFLSFASSTENCRWIWCREWVHWLSIRIQSAYRHYIRCMWTVQRMPKPVRWVQNLFSPLSSVVASHSFHFRLIFLFVDFAGPWDTSSQSGQEIAFASLVLLYAWLRPSDRGRCWNLFLFVWRKFGQNAYVVRTISGAHLEGWILQLHRSTAQQLLCVHRFG